VEKDELKTEMRKQNCRSLTYSLCERRLEEICKQYYAICFILQVLEQSSQQVQ
jgi:hypothetical protein